MMSLTLYKPQHRDDIKGISDVVG